MGKVFTLDSLREEVEKEYAPIILELADGTQIQLRNLLRLPKKDRTTALEYLKVIEDNDGADGAEVDKLVDTATKLLTLVSDDPRSLAKELGDELSLILKLLNVWMDGSQPGEAKPSPS